MSLRPSVCPSVREIPVHKAAYAAKNFDIFSVNSEINYPASICILSIKILLSDLTRNYPVTLGITQSQLVLVWIQDMRVQLLRIDLFL